MDNDNEIAGDPTALPHLLLPASRHPTTVSGFAGLAASLAQDRAAWEPLVRYDATCRWYHRLRTGPGYDAWLLSWVPGQGSGRHDHGASHGVYTVVRGALTEYTEHGPRLLSPGPLRYFAPGFVHAVVNAALGPAVSVHVYFPGLTHMPRHAPDFEPSVRGVASC
ncbi:cysteine dioxygenase family protein [Streptomyces sodiiphilus]|uniref:Cysteine dioxygenase family protein n=1 Tax=Streptomyces sodiiphilus TaxID=226217 RepID=A0ABN2PNC9_9ACTN